MGMIRGGWGRLTMLSYFKLFDIIANESSRSPWNDVIIIFYAWALVRSGETTRPLTVWQLFEKCSIWENPNLAELVCADLLCGGRPVGVWYFPCIQSHHAQSWKLYFKATWGRWQSVLAALFPLTSLHPGHNFHENHDDATANVDDDHNKCHLYPLSWCSIGLCCEKCHRGGTWHCQSDDKDVMIMMIMMSSPMTTTTDQEAKVQRALIDEMLLWIHCHCQAWTFVHRDHIICIWYWKEIRNYDHNIKMTNMKPVISCLGFNKSRMC